MKRTLALLVAVISAAVLLSACGSNGGPAAAKVGSTTISRATLDDELNVLSKNTSWINALSQSSGVNLDAPEGGISTKLSSEWLNLLVNQAIVDQTFEHRHLNVTPTDRTAAKAAALGIFSNAATFGRFPRWFRDTVLRRQERYSAVSATVPPAAAPTDAEIQSLFQQQGTQICPTSEAVAQIQVDTKDEADAIEAQLAQGADFVTLAAEQSKDTQSAKNGGIIACKQTSQFSQLPASLQEAANALAIGQISQPVQSTAGWHVVKMVQWDLESARGVLSTIIESQRPSPVAAFVQSVLVKSKIWIDPRYGTVKKGAGRVTINPPTAPDPSSKPPTPSTTAPAAATGQ